MTVNKGDWVRIHTIVLEADKRSDNLPEDTAKVPLELWVKGYAQEKATIGDEIKIRTILGREVQGKVIEKNPTYAHSFGQFIPELNKIGIQVKELLRKEE